MSPDVNAFGPVAPYYDELMKQVPYRMWVGYYFLLLSVQDSHPKQVLDVACGTGTMTQMLAKEGLQMSGVDISPPMIEMARKKALLARLPIDYHVADASEMELGAQFDGALSFFDSLNNILEPERLQSAFDRIAAHLISGSSFIFDMNAAYAFAMKMFDQQSLRSNAKLRYKWEGDWNPSTRLIRVHMRFWYASEEFEEIHVQRAYELEEIQAMLKIAGFGKIRAYHSYSLDKPRAKSDRIHFAALKA